MKKPLVIFSAILVVIIVIIAVTLSINGNDEGNNGGDGDNGDGNDIDNGTQYQLTHSSVDVEHILDWNLLISRNADIGTYDKIEAFVYRGESEEYASHETFSLGLDSPAAWGSTRLVRSEWVGQNFRSFAVLTMFCENEQYLNDMVSLWGIPVQQEGDFLVGVIETETPMQSIQILIAGKNFAVLVGEFASIDPLFFTKDAIMELVTVIESNISNIEVTTLPSQIPARQS